MKQITCMVLLALCLPLSSMAQQADARVAYIDKYKDIAIKNMNKTGIPASITLAQAILESNAGQSTLAREANNHFGIKCGSQWKGKEFYKEDDDRDANGNLIKSCFRKYRKVEQSYNDHSEFLTDPRKHYRYGHLFNLDPEDYKSWAYGLQSSGYATAPDYGDRLIRIIENYKLYLYDSPTGRQNNGNVAGSDDFNPTPMGGRRPTGRVNDAKVIMTAQGETIDDISAMFGISPRKIVCYNDCQYGQNEKLAEKTRIYIQNKLKKNRGRKKIHIVGQDETMFAIAQKYGIKLENLYKMNNMRGGTEPASGEEIWLKTGWFSKRKDPVRLADPNRPKPTDPTNTSTTGVPNPNRPGVPPTRPGTTGQSDNQPQDGAVLPPGSAYEPDDDPLFDDDKPSTGSNNNGGVITTGTGRPDQPTPPKTEPTMPPYNPPTGQNPSTQNPTGTVQYHTVVKGDTLWNISQRYGLKVDQLKALNSLSGDYIQIGQQLRVK